MSSYFLRIKEYQPTLIFAVYQPNVKVYAYKESVRVLKLSSMQNFHSASEQCCLQTARHPQGRQQAHHYSI